MSMTIIVARSRNGIIGNEGKIPWNIRTDTKRFAELTTGSTVIVGRITHEEILKKLGHPLKLRKTIVVTRQHSYRSSGCYIANSFEKALEMISDEQVFVIGGEQLYKQALPFAETIYLTEVDVECDGDASFVFDETKWEAISTESHLADSKNGDEYNFEFKILRKKTYINIQNARLPEQLEAMKRIENRKQCPFCPENLLKEHSQPILWEGNYWLLTKNQWPYAQACSHLLAIYKEHAEKLSDISPDAGKELFEMFRWVEKTFDIVSGGVAFRFGDIRFNGATVSHIHVHILEPNPPTEEDYAPIRFRIGAKK